MHIYFLYILHIYNKATISKNEKTISFSGTQ